MLYWLCVQNVETTFGLRVQWDRSFSVRVTVHPDYMTKVCGMCGDFNGKLDNDQLLGPNTEKCVTRLTKSRKPGQKVCEAYTDTAGCMCYNL